MRRFFSYLSYFLILLFVVSLDSAFFPALGGFWAQMNLILAFGIFLTIVFRRQIALTSYTIMGIIAGLTSSSEIIVPLVIGILTITLIDILAETLLTNRSYYTIIALGISGWYIYYILYASISFISTILALRVYAPDITLGWVGAVIINSLILGVFMSAGYIITSFTSKRFRSYFIIHSGRH